MYSVENKMLFVKHIYLLSLFKRNQDSPTSSFIESVSPSGSSRVRSEPRASVASLLLCNMPVHLTATNSVDYGGPLFS